MKCKKFEMLIAEYVEGDLSAGKARKVDQHLAECPDCREFADGLRLSQSALKALAHFEIPSVSLDRVRAEVMKSVASQPLRPSGHRWQFAAGAAAVVIAAGAAVLWHARQSRPVLVSNAEHRTEAAPPQARRHTQAESKTGHRKEVQGKQLTKMLPAPAATTSLQHLTRQAHAHANRTKLAERESQPRLHFSDEEAGVSAQSIPPPSESPITGASASTVPALKFKLISDDPNVVIYLIID